MQHARWALGLLLAASLLQPATALRCERRIVNEQDSMLQVLSRCGDPALRDRHPAINISGQGFFGYPEETWYYNFGPRRLVHVLRFRNNRLISIETDGYGFHPIARPSCMANDIHEGMSKLRLLAACGEPVARDQFYQLQPQFVHGEVVGQRGVLRESWHYNFGKRRLLREVILEDGKVSDIKTQTGHGY